jgi:hypothetical protein
MNRRALIAAIGLVAACGGEPLAPRVLDRWGAAGVELRFLADGADLQLDCTTAHVPGALAISPQGTFAGTATVVSGATIGDSIPLGGQIAGDTMQLGLELPSAPGLHLDAHYTLLHGVAGTFDPRGCPPAAQPDHAP